MTLQDCRDGINNIDNQLIQLLNQRMEFVKKVGEIKQVSGGSIYRPEREREILDRLKELNNGNLSDAAIEAIFLEIFAVSRNAELPEKVAFLGPDGSFTHQAAESRFGAMSDYLAMHSIRAVFQAVESKRAKFAVIPIENNLDGVVRETMDMLASTTLKIVAEIVMPIHHSLATRYEDLRHVKKIYSKDVAFGQCRNFLYDHNLEDIELIPVESTAKAAKLASIEPNSAAICSHVAAKLYNLPLLFENIEDVHTNLTRFIILSDFKNAASENDKTSLLVKLPNTNEPGILYKFLSEFEEAHINLNKIESRPTKVGSRFEYQFFIDFDGHIDDANVQEVLAKRENEITWLGSYVKGK